MKMFSDCSGPCETCANNYELTGANCMAGHGDDHYVEVDNCEVCLGRNGGVRGNENVIDGVAMCDYCMTHCAECGRVGGIVTALSRRRTYNVCLQIVRTAGGPTYLCQWCRAKR